MSKSHITLAVIIAVMSMAPAFAGEDVMPMRGEAVAEVGAGSAPVQYRRVLSTDPPPAKPALRYNRVELKLPSLGPPTERRLQVVEAKPADGEGVLVFSPVESKTMLEGNDIPGLIGPELLALDHYSFMDKGQVQPAIPLEQLYDFGGDPGQPDAKRIQEEPAELSRQEEPGRYDFSQDIVGLSPGRRGAFGNQPSFHKVDIPDRLEPPPHLATLASSRPADTMAIVKTEPSTAFAAKPVLEQAAGEDLPAAALGSLRPPAGLAAEQEKRISVKPDVSGLADSRETAKDQLDITAYVETNILNGWPDDVGMVELPPPLFSDIRTAEGDGSETGFSTAPAIQSGQTVVLSGSGAAFTEPAAMIWTEPDTSPMMELRRVLAPVLSAGTDGAQR